jgi:hypothetical protein
MRIVPQSSGDFIAFFVETGFTLPKFFVTPPPVPGTMPIDVLLRRLTMPRSNDIMSGGRN